MTETATESTPTFPRLRPDGGFTVAEAAVALLLVALVFLGFSTSLMSSLRASRDNRFRQTGTAVVTEYLEAGRSLVWDEVAMPYVDDTAPMVSADGTSLVGAEAGLGSDEVLLVSGAGLVFPMTIENSDGNEYTVWSYVTLGPRGLRRLMVLAEWEFEGGPRHFQSSTLIAEAASG